MELYDYLRMMASKEASDLFFSTGAPPNIKIEGHVAQINETVLMPGEIKNMAYVIISSQLQRDFDNVL